MRPEARAAALICALALVGGCEKPEPRQALEECRFELRKAMPGVDPDSPLAYLQPGTTDFMKSCMSAKHFDYATTVSGCGVTTGPFTEACYRPR